MSARDAEVARQKAAQRIEQARRISEAVDQYHQAADAIDAAQRTVAAASQDRVAALRMMRDEGMSISEIAELTALSPSRIQALVRGEADPGTSASTDTEVVAEHDQVSGNEPLVAS
jgi:hypothetical protein